MLPCLPTCVDSALLLPRPSCVQEWGLPGGAYASPFGVASFGPPPEAFASASSSAGPSQAGSTKMQKQISDSSCLPCLRSAQSTQAVSAIAGR